MRTIEVKKISITELNTEIIVNAANEHLRHGGGVCGYIFQAAGAKQLQDACDQIGHCPAGSAVITPGFKLCRYIVHAVGPVWQGGSHHEPQLLYGCYTASLNLAEKYSCHSIGFPLISAGIYGYPADKAWQIAVQAISDWFRRHRDYELEVIFAALDAKIVKMGRGTILDTAPIYYRTSKDDWKTQDMPEKNVRFILERSFTKAQMDALRQGNLPREMEDKWFLYMEGNTFYAHRSWTGYCIYKIAFQEDGRHIVTANRDPEQYKCTSIEEDLSNLNHLLYWWTQNPYDHYNEWLSETAVNLEKAGKIKEQLKLKDRTADAVFFHLPQEPNGYLSNWYSSPFELDGIRFTSCEQYIMYRKCMLFGDQEAAEAVLGSDDPALQQSFGRSAKGFIPAVWDGIKQAVVMRSLRAKFEQNDSLKKQLLETGSAYLVECAGSDHVWACGRKTDDDRRFDISQWDGQNLLGFALMEVRESLKH